MFSGHRRRFGVIAIFALAAVATWLVFSGGLAGMRRTSALRRARTFLNHPEVASARFTPPENSSATATGAATSQHSRRSVSIALLNSAAGSRSTEALITAGIAFALEGDFNRAAATFNAIPVAERDAAIWNDLAAAHLAATRSVNPHEHLLAAIEASDRALMIDPRSAPALFNRARATDSLGLFAASQAAWKQYLLVDRTSPWSAVARKRITETSTTDVDRWREASRGIDTMNESELQALAMAFPQQVRLHAEGISLSTWAEALDRGDEAAATRMLEQARIVGRALERQSGEFFVADAVRAIDAASAERKRVIAAGHLAYRAGRQAVRDGFHDSAERNLSSAARLLRSGKSPIAALAELYLSGIRIDQGRAFAAQEILEPLLAAELARHQSHPALIAHIRWYLALCEAQRGHWSSSMLAAEVATAAYRRLGERGHAAATEAILAEDYDLLGQPALAWKHGIAALGSASLAGNDPSRPRAILAALCRTELRGRHWQHAAALVELERRSAARGAHSLDADMFLRAAVARFHAGDRNGAQQAVQKARYAAQSHSDGAMRAKLVADVDAVAGSMLRIYDVQRALPLLTRAIDFQRSVGRSIVLPQLYLERGRALHSLGQIRDAETDFDAGIEELERQRSLVTQTELRPGVFHDASDLFDEAIRVRLDSKRDPQDVLALVERARARVVFEEMEADSPLSVLGELHDHISSGALLVEYLSLPDRLVIFVADKKKLTMRVTATSRARLTEEANAFGVLLATNAPIAEVLRQAGTMYDLLLAPIEERLADTASITFVSDTSFQGIPFAALLDRRSRSFLIERHEIATAPSAAVFVANGRRLRRMTPRPPVSAAIFANPDVPRSSYPYLASLAGAETEAVRIARHYQKPLLLRRGDATAGRFIALAPSSDVVHYGGHAVIHPNDLGSSALILTPSGHEAGPVTQRSIARMRFRSTRLVVLAACSTTSGRNASIEGVPSLARAFLMAGVPAVIGTLWDIEDQQAVSIVGRIHEEIARGATPTQAVRAAQMEALRSTDPMLRHPSRWSAFSLLGR